MIYKKICNITKCFMRRLLLSCWQRAIVNIKTKSANNCGENKSNLMDSRCISRQSTTRTQRRSKCGTFLHLLHDIHDVNVERMHVVVCLLWGICVGLWTLSRDRRDFSMIGPRFCHDSVVLTRLQFVIKSSLFDRSPACRILFPKHPPSWRQWQNIPPRD